MQVHRKGTDDAIKLRLSLNQKSTDELQQMLLRRDPANTRRYLFDAKTRHAATCVLRVRGQAKNGGVSTPMSEPIIPAVEKEADRTFAAMPQMTKARIYNLIEQIDTLNQRVCTIVKMIEASDHPDAEAIAGELWDQCAIIASARDIVDDLCIEEG